MKSFHLSKTIISLAIFLSSICAKGELPILDRAAIAALFTDIKADDVSLSPISNVYQVTQGYKVTYVTSDGQYLIKGEIIDVKHGNNLTDEEVQRSLGKILSTYDESRTLIFEPEKTITTITVFADTECVYCRRFHSGIDRILNAGIRVRYLFTPSGEIGEKAWNNARSILCSEEPQVQFTAAMAGHEIEQKTCDSSQVEDNFEFSRELGITRAPIVFSESGVILGGYVTPEKLIEKLVL